MAKQHAADAVLNQLPCKDCRHHSVIRSGCVNLTVTEHAVVVVDSSFGPSSVLQMLPEGICWAILPVTAVTVDIPCRLSV